MRWRLLGGAAIAVMIGASVAWVATPSGTDVPSDGAPTAEGAISAADVRPVDLATLAKLPLERAVEQAYPGSKVTKCTEIEAKDPPAKGISRAFTCAGSFQGQECVSQIDRRDNGYPSLISTTCGQAKS